MTPLPQHTARGFVSRVLAVGVGELVAKAAAAFAFFRLARVLQPDVYGQVEWALSCLLVATMVADAGLGTWAASQIGAAPARAPRVAGQVGWIRLVLAIIVVAGLRLVAGAVGGGAGAALQVYALVLLLTPWIVPYLFNGLLRSEWAGVVNATRGGVFLLAVWWLVPAGAPASRVALAELLGAVAAAGASVLAVRYALRLRIPLDGVVAGARQRLAQSAPIAVSELTWAAMWYTGLLLLGSGAPGTATAWYGAALRLVIAVHSLVYLYFFVLLPTLARELADDPERWRQLIEGSLRTTGWLGGLVALVGTLGARPLLVTMYGAPFEAAVPLLHVLVWMVPITWVSGHHRYSFVASNRPMHDSQAAVIGAVVTVVLSLALVPRLHAVGAAAALIAGVVSNAVAAAVMARRVLPPLAFLPNIWPGPLASVACLGLGVMLTPLAGDIRATLVASALLTAVALVAERRRWPRLLIHAA